MDLTHRPENNQTKSMYVPVCYDFDGHIWESVRFLIQITVRVVNFDLALQLFRIGITSDGSFNVE